MTNIILTGFMGTGKTTVGKLVALELAYEFVDTDLLIEVKAGLAISDIFATLGEAVFRKMEAAVAQDLANRDGLVIATGGRLMLADRNARVLGKNGRIFCLVATPDEILARVQQDGATRPLLAGANPRAKIVAILQERETKYAQFEQVVTSGKTPVQIAAEIVGGLVDVL